MAKEKAHSPEVQQSERIKWRDDVAPHDYAAAEAYLSLKLDSEVASKAVKRLD